MKPAALLLTVTLLCWGSLALAGDRVFVAESYLNQVGVIDSSAGSVSPINVGLLPQDVKLTADGKSLYSVNYASHDLTEIDPLTAAIRRSINLSCSPAVMSIAVDGTTGYVLCRNAGRLLYLDLPTGKETGSVAIPFPHGLALSPDGQRAYVSRSMFSRYVDVIDLNLRKVVTSITVGRSPQGIVVGPSGRFAYVANAGAASVSVIDLAANRVQTTITVGNGPVAVAVNSDESLLYAANSYDASVSVIDLTQTKVIATIPVGVSPHALALSSKEPVLYVANFSSNTTSMVSTLTNKTIRTIAVGNGPRALAVLSPNDTTPPQLDLSLDREHLWPPNHKLVPVTVQLDVTDDQDPYPTVQLVSITDNESCIATAASTNTQTARSADPQSCNDIAEAEFGTPDTTFLLRAERLGRSDEGRIYTITYKATDDAGNESLSTVTVQVPISYPN